MAKKKTVKLCRYCKHVKVIDSIVGRCMKKPDAAPLFCKLDDPKHPCDHYKKAPKKKAVTV